MRNRKLFIPIIHAPDGCDKKIHHLGAMVTGVYDTFCEFELGDLSDAEKEQLSDLTLLEFFYRSYAKALLRVKKSRRAKLIDPATHHENAMRASIYDNIHRYFQAATEVYESRFLDDDEFYKKLCIFAMFTGQVHTWMQFAIDGRLDDAIVIIEQREARKKGADATHRENRAMKAEIFTWLDGNNVGYKSIEAAASAITKQQPIAHVTGRDWYKEWKKLRSAGTP